MGSFFLVTVMHTVFLRLIFICHLVHQLSSWFRDPCRATWSLELLISWYIMQSSAKSLILQEIFVVMSFINIRKSRGPRTEPWGTPDVTGMLSECTFSKITNCERPYKKSSIQFVRFPVPSILLSSAFNFLWHTESNAFEKSSSIKSVCERLLIEKARSCTTSVSYVAVDSPFLNPCW